jgi:hypothetical protein
VTILGDTVTVMVTPPRIDELDGENEVIATQYIRNACYISVVHLLGHTVLHPCAHERLAEQVPVAPHRPHSGLAKHVAQSLP